MTETLPNGLKKIHPSVLSDMTRIDTSIDTRTDTHTDTYPSALSDTSTTHQWTPERDKSTKRTMEKFGTTTPEHTKCRPPHPPPNQPKFTWAPRCPSKCSCPGRQEYLRKRAGRRAFVELAENEN